VAQAKWRKPHQLWHRKKQLGSKYGAFCRKVSTEEESLYWRNAKTGALSGVSVAFVHQWSQAKLVARWWWSTEGRIAVY
jgi:hypothetical protein